MYKLIFKLVLELISRPSKTWKSLAAERERGVQEGRNKEQHERFLSNYVYPFIGLMTVAAFMVGYILICVVGMLMIGCFPN